MKIIPKKIKWGLIGLGVQGENMARSIASSKNGVLYFVASKNIKRAENFAKKHGSEYFGTLNNLLKNPELDAVLIASKNNEHLRHVSAAASAKKHILCEKPLALSLKDGLSIANAVKKHRIRFAVGFHIRHHPAVEKAKKIIDSGLLGKILLIKAHWCIGHQGAKLPPLPAYMRWRENIKEGGGAFMARGTHLLDLIHYFTNKKPGTIFALMDKDKKADRTALGIIDYGDFFAEIATSKTIPYLGDFMGIYGDKGNIELRSFMAPNSSAYLIFKTKKGLAKKIKATAHHKVLPDALISRSQSFKKENLWKKEVEDFGDMIISGKKTPNAGLEDGLHNISVANAFIKSARSGTTRRFF